MRILDCKDMELNTHPTGGAYDLLGHMPEIQIEDPIFPVTVRISIRLTARQGQQFRFHFLIAPQFRLLSCK